MHTVYTYTVVALCFIVINYVELCNEEQQMYCALLHNCMYLLCGLIMPKIGTERGTAGVCVRVRVRVCVHVCACV